MRNILAMIIVCVFLFITLAGCDETAPAPTPSPESRPIASGIVVSGTLWNNPVSASVSNSGNPVTEGSRVEVYNEFIIVTSPQGISELSPHGWYSNLKFKKE